MASIFQINRVRACSHERVPGAAKPLPNRAKRLESSASTFGFVSDFGFRISGLLAAGLLCLAPLCSQAADTTKPKPPQPAKLAIRGYGFLGNREIKHTLVTVELNKKRPEYFGAPFVEDSALLISARVMRDGYLAPNIDIRLTLADGRQLDTTAKALQENPLPRSLRIIQAEFTIHKGVLYHFEKLDFSGLKTIPPKQARAYFEVTETLFHPKGARVYTPERLQQGLSSLTAALDQQGYQEASAQVAHLHRDDKNGRVSVQIHVHQGPKFIVHSVQQEIFHAGNPEPLRPPTDYPNKPDSRLWREDFTLTLKTNEYVQGYPDVTVDWRTLQRHAHDGQVQMDLLATVKTGPKVWIGAVGFEGEKRTRKWFMARRAKVDRGELLNPIRVEEGRNRLAELGVFDSVDVDYKVVNEHTRDVLYRVQEGKFLNVQLLAGWGSYELLRGGVIVTENNIFGLAHEAELKAVQSFKSTSGDFRYTVPEVVGRDVDLFLHGSGLRREELDFTRLEYGGGVGVHKYYKASALDASLHYDYQILNALSLVPEVASEGLTNPAVGSITLDLKLDRRDNPLYPRRGYKVFATVETASQYLGGEANYERVEITPAWYHPLGGGRYINLAVSHGVAVSFGNAANNLPFDKRFFPGGPESIRGYQQDEASPRNAFGQIVGAETYALGSVQLEQALTPRWSLVLFSDSLGFAQHLNHYPFDTGLFSVGAGIWWRTIIGPVRLEYGHNLNPRPGDPSGTVQFSFGFPF